MKRNLTFLIILLGALTLTGATKYLQGDAVKSADLSKTWTMPSVSGTLLQSASPTISGTASFTGDVVIGNNTLDANGISVDGTLYESTLNLADVNGTHLAQTILNRHSTTLEPVMVMSRSNANTTAHTNVTSGMSLGTIYGAGVAGTDYKLFGGLTFAASSSGTISGDSSPGKLLFKVTPNGSKVPATALTIESSGDATFASNVNASGDVSISGDYKIDGSTTNQLVQNLISSTSTVATGTTVLPVDNTIPQNTEGNQYMSLTITPKNASNILEIDVLVHLDHDANAWRSIALFQDSTVNALSAAIVYNATVNSISQVKLKYRMIAGTTSATTFKIRGGANGAGTTTFNGSAGVQFFGGVINSYIAIKEYTP